MSKRGMEFQGGGERYNGADREEKGGDAPRAATAAQMARRKPGSQRGSRQASPAVGPVNAFNPQQIFQPPQTGSFDFKFGDTNSNNSNNNDNNNTSNNITTPTFGQQPPPQPQQNSSFNFGASTPAQPSIQAPVSSAGLFGSQNTISTSSFSNSFSTNNHQSQQNGSGPASTSIFSTPSTNSTTMSNPFSFGQKQPPNPSQSTGAGSGPSKSFGGQANGNNAFSSDASKPANEENPGTTSSFTGFGAAQHGQSQGPPLFGALSASYAAGETPKLAPPAFGGFAALPSGQTASTTRAPASPIFTGFKEGAKKIVDTNGEAPSIFNFGAGTTPAGPTTAKSGESIFSGLAQPSIKPGMFTQSGQNSKAATTQDEAACRFDGQQNQKQQNSPFKFASTPAETPKASSSIFQQFKNPMPDKTPAPTFGLSEDTSMHSPENTPKKSGKDQNQVASTVFSGFANAQDPAPPAEKISETTVNNVDKPGSMFDRMEKRGDMNATPKPTFSFGVSTATPTRQSQPAVPQTEKPLSRHDQPPAPPATEPRPSASLFPITKTNVVTASKPTPAAPTTNIISASTAAPISSNLPVQRNDMKSVNTGFLHVLKNADVNADWSSFALIYLTEVTKLRQKDVFSIAQTAVPSTVVNDATPKVPSFTNMFENQTPSQKLSTPQPPATAPVSKKRSADEPLTKSTEGTATEKRFRAGEPVEYRKLSENASKSAKLFESVLDKSASGTPKFGPPDDIVNKVREDAANKTEGGKSTGFTSSTASLFSSGSTPSGTPNKTTGSTTSKASFGFTPSAPSSRATGDPADAPKFGFVPAVSLSGASAKQQTGPPKFGFTPSVSSSTAAAPSAGVPTSNTPSIGAGNFLSAFGKKAEANAEQEKKKRKAEDYDSEEDDEAEWEAKYEAEQQEKRRKIEAATNSSSAFGFKPASATSTTSSSSSAFSFGQSKSAAADTESKKVSAQQLEKQTGTGDKTWQPKSPIKFGNSLNTPDPTTPAAAPPAKSLAGLFGPGKQTSVTKKPEAVKPPPPSLGFGFASPTPTLGASRPAIIDDVVDEEVIAAAINSEPSDTLNDKQVEDMTALLPTDREDNDVLLEIPICKVSKFMPKQNEDGKSAMAWVERGKGPLYILRNKSSGKTSVLLKVAPLGKVAMNFLLLGGNAEYKLAQGRTKHVSGPFVDHLDGGAKKPSSWLMQVGRPEDAQEMARVMQENRPTE
nr:nucleoporin [Quercus suber]